MARASSARLIGLIIAVSIIGMLASCESGYEHVGPIPTAFFTVLKQSSGCTGCEPEPPGVGTLRVTNDGTVSVTRIHVTSGTATGSEPNLLTEPLPTGWAIEMRAERGVYTVVVVDALNRSGTKSGVLVYADTTTVVRISEIIDGVPGNDTDPDASEGEADDTVPDDSEGEDGDEDTDDPEGEGEGEDTDDPEGEGEGEDTDDPEGEGDDGLLDTIALVETSGPHDFEGGMPLEITMSDGARLTFPALPAEEVITTVTLNTVEAALDLTDYEITPVGKVRDLVFESFDPADHDLYTADFAPTLTIPAAELAGIDTASLTVIRIGNLYLTDETPRRAQVHFLSPTFTASGDLQFTDFYMADSIISDIILRDVAPEKQITLFARSTRYVLAQLAPSANYSMEPLLQRFYPVATRPNRAVFTDLDEDRQEQENEKTIRNVVVMVHGYHNNEKLGSGPATAEAPWYYNYKRDAWTLFYDYIRQQHADILACTAFYEYIYPTYRPIFTAGAGPRLDEDFARAVRDMVQDHNWDGWFPGKADVRLYIVAHSMGGVVARAGIQLFEEETHDAFQRLVTWGTPHLGTPLLSLRRVLSAPAGIYSLRRGLVNVPMGNIDNTLYIYRRALEYFIPDAPGIRDLQWARSHTSTPHNLRLEEYFSFDVDAALDPALWNLYDLHNGTEIFNPNLNRLNSDDVYRLSEEYRAVYGINPNRPTISTSRWRWPRVDGIAPLDLGATVMPWLIKDADQSYEGAVRGDNDGIVPVASMMGAGVTVSWRRSRFDNTHHEDYFGYPDDSGVFRDEAKAFDVSSETMRVFGIEPCAVQVLLDLQRQPESPDGIEYGLVIKVSELPPDLDNVAIHWNFGDGRPEAQGMSVASVSGGKAEVAVSHVYEHVLVNTTHTITVSVLDMGDELARVTTEIMLSGQTFTVRIYDSMIFATNGGGNDGVITIPDPECEPLGSLDDFKFEGCIEPSGIFPSYEYRWELQINQDNPQNFTQTDTDNCNMLTGWYSNELSGTVTVSLDVYSPDGDLLGSHALDGISLDCYPY